MLCETISLSQRVPKSHQMKIRSYPIDLSLFKLYIELFPIQETLMHRASPFFPNDSRAPSK